MDNKIRKAIIPAAGLGTRFLPATKAQPKEMLPIVDKPTLQYIIEEAIASGIEEILIITGRNKKSIEDHFDRSVELELELEKKGTEVSYKYVFDAKYRIEKEPESPFYPDPNNNPEPKVDDINTMHRYRDSIVYENKVSKFTFEKCFSIFYCKYDQTSRVLGFGF